MDEPDPSSAAPAPAVTATSAGGEVPAEAAGMTHDLSTDSLADIS